MKKSTLIIIVVAVIVLTLAVGAFLLIQQMNSIPKPGTGGSTSSYRPEQSGKVTNLLLVCVDGGDKTALSPFLGSDGILLMSINEGTRKIVMTGFRADTQVRVSKAYDDTLDHVYRDGGVELLKKTLSENFGLLPDHYAVVKDSDLGDLAGSSKSSLRDLGLSELTSLAKSLSKKANTDMSATDLLGFGMKAADLRSYKGVTLTLPDDGGFEIGELDGRSVLIPDLETCAALLDKTIYE